MTTEELAPATVSEELEPVAEAVDEAAAEPTGEAESANEAEAEPAAEPAAATEDTLGAGTPKTPTEQPTGKKIPSP